MKRLKKFALIILLITTSIVTKAQTFSNSILSVFYPDPTVNPSFTYYPGLPVFHNTGLLNWQQVNYALNNISQLNLDGVGVSKGLFPLTIKSLGHTIKTTGKHILKYC